MKQLSTYASQVLISGALCLGYPLSGHVQEFSLQELADPRFNALDLEQICKDCEDDFVVKIEAGTRLPLKLNLRGSVLSLEAHSMAPVLIVNETFYVKILPLIPATGCFYCDSERTEDPSSQLLFSRDALSWSSCEEFFGGNLTTSVEADEVTAEPVATFSLDVHFKE